MPDITKGKTFTSGETVTATELNSLIDDAVINNLAVDSNKLAADAVTNVKVAAAAAIDWDKMAALSSGQILVGNSDNQAAGVAMSGDATISNTGVVTLDPNAVIPSGSITQYAGSTAPTGWLICDGTAVSRTTYADLYAIVSTTYGTGDGSTTFNLPDLRGRMPMGVGQGNTAEGGGLGTSRALAATGGAEGHTLTESELPAHTHTSLHGRAGSSSRPSGYTDNYNSSSPNNFGGGSTDDSWGSSHTSSVGGGSSHDITGPFLVVNFIIKT